MLKREANRSADKAICLCVDLDGTLIRSDSLAESFLALIAKNLFYCLLVPIWLLRGKAYLKRQIARRVDIEPSLLPYNEELLRYLKAEKASGRPLALATAADELHANAIAEHLGIFDAVFASDGDTNLSGSRKLDRLNAAFGVGNFDYAANSKVDLPIWQSAREAIIVNPHSGVQAQAAKVADVARVFDDRRGWFRQLVNALRLHQWVKNVLIFVPLVLDHRINEPGLLIQAFWAFCAFGFCASSVYILNDLVDIAADRKHQTKRRRPFASGRLPIALGTAMIPLLLAISLGFASLLPIEFLGGLGLYYLITLAYTFRLKRVQIIDVIVLAGLYTMRIIAGGLAVDVTPSFWLLSFSMFFFLSLALAKRYVELSAIQAQEMTKSHGRGYVAQDLETMAHFGINGGYIAILVLALYINSEDVTALYVHPEVIWLLCPIVLYLVSRIWLKARRNELHEDPVIFVLRDLRSQLLVAIGAILLWIATVLPQ
ncbi:MAG: UbiA family prenyltransferase [Hyphomicrobiales bacterium]|nr:UbiA family prenyltransferase [Hyphomicrobiales bacterium]